MGYLQDIIDKSKKKVAGYDPSAYRQEIADASLSHGLNYVESGAEQDDEINFGGNQSKNYKPLIFGSIGALILIAGGIILYKRKKAKK